MWQTECCYRQELSISIAWATDQQLTEQHVRLLGRHTAILLRTELISGLCWHLTVTAVEICAGGDVVTWVSDTV